MTLSRNGWDFRLCGCLWEKKGLSCYESDAKCILAGGSRD